MRFFDTFPSGIEDIITGITLDHELIDLVTSQVHLDRFAGWKVHSTREVFGWREGSVPSSYSARNLATIQNN
jgi:hypothetical protein